MNSVYPNHQMTALANASFKSASNVCPNNYSSFMTPYHPEDYSRVHEKDSDSNDKKNEMRIKKQVSRDRVESQIPFQGVDLMVKFRLKLLRISKQMTRNDRYYFHHQMKKRFHSLTDDVQEPRFLFNLLIKHGLIGPSNTEFLVESLFALKRHDLMSILTDKQQLFQKPAVPLFDRDALITDKFVLQLCNQDIGPDDLCQLAVNGFKLPFVVLQRAQYDSKTTKDATLAVFSQWRQQAPHSDLSMLSADSMPPYTKKGLARALKDAQLNFILHKYFN